jgi:hypothetical protein
MNARDTAAFMKKEHEEARSIMSDLGALKAGQ